MTMNPEQKARTLIDQKLVDAGWLIQDYKNINLGAGDGIAVCEHPIQFPTGSGFADYLLYIKRTPVGVIEAKRDSAGENLTRVESQTQRYAAGTLKWRTANVSLKFLFEATGQIIRFTDGTDPVPRSREMDVSMALTGIKDISQINRSILHLDR